MPLDVARRGTLDVRDPPLKAIVDVNDNYEAGYHKGNAGGLDAIDTDLATANIKNGITIFGKVGSADVHDISDATAVEAEVLAPETFYAVGGGIRTGTMPTVAITAVNDNYPAGYHAGNVGGLSAIDVNLAAANILNGVNIFGFVGPATVQDIADANALVGDVKDPKTFYSVTGARKTGTMPTVALAPGSSAYPAGYHAGDGGGLPAIDADLATANIKNGITIFNVAGHVNVRDVSDANALVGEVRTGRTFYAVGGARKTGTMPTVALAAGANAYPAGYHVGAASLTAVDGDLVTGSIKFGVTIFGVNGHTDVRDSTDADAAVANVLSPKTFYAGGGAKKTGTMATVAIVAANDNYPAGYHAGDAGGLDAIDTDLAPGNIKLGVTIFGFVGTYSPALIEDVIGYSTPDTGTHAGYYGKEVQVNAGADTIIATKTLTFAAGSRAVAVGSANARTGFADEIKLRLYMGGVEVAESVYYITTHGDTYILIYTEALSGEQTCYIAFHNYTGGILFPYTGGGYATGCDLTAVIGVGSIKT